MSRRIERTGAPPESWTALARVAGSFYHEPLWVETIARTFKFPLDCLTAFEGDRPVAALALASVPSLGGRPHLVSFPFSYVAGSIGDPAADADLARYAIALAGERRVRYLEIKRPGAPALVEPLVRVARYHTFEVPLAGGSDAVWTTLDGDSTRRGIRKAQKTGLRVERVADRAGWEAMAAFQDDTARRHGLPAPPRHFWREGVTGLAAHDLARAYLAFADGTRPVAGITVWTAPSRWIYAFGGADSRYLDRRPNHLLLWTAMADAMAEGSQVFDLGRAAPEQEGLVTFKRRWGGQPVPLAYDYWPAPRGVHLAPRNRGPLRVAARVWSALPLGITRLGSSLYRYLG
ncbi:MAG: GNAT family N-acetyltransferase [Gemmatimonadales bacterium]|nr:GNAT family N-acetyltransferase [Gemmatimonadales bacterium]